jgi:hypothetical protein
MEGSIAILKHVRKVEQEGRGKAGTTGDGAGAFSNIFSLSWYYQLVIKLVIKDPLVHILLPGTKEWPFVHPA